MQESEILIKYKPAYNLETAQELIKSDDTRKISMNAHKGANSIGYSLPE